MKTKEEILKTLEQLEKDYDVDALPEYIRGFYSALSWVVREEDESK